MFGPEAARGGLGQRRETESAHRALDADGREEHRADHQGHAPEAFARRCHGIGSME
jgi:hypothetical protein